MAQTKTKKPARRRKVKRSTPSAAPSASTPATPEAPRIVEVSIPRVPLAPVDDDRYAPGHFEVKLSIADSRAFGRLIRGLDQSETRLGNGRCVQRPADAFRWLLEQVAAAAEDA